MEVEVNSAITYFHLYMLAFENCLTLQLENAEPVALSCLIPSRDKQEGKLLGDHGK